MRLLPAANDTPPPRPGQRLLFVFFVGSVGTPPPSLRARSGPHRARYALWWPVRGRGGHRLLSPRSPAATPRLPIVSRLPPHPRHRSGPARRLTSQDTTASTPPAPHGPDPCPGVPPVVAAAGLLHLRCGDKQGFLRHPPSLPRLPLSFTSATLRSPACLLRTSATAKTPPPASTPAAASSAQAFPRIMASYSLHWDAASSALLLHPLPTGSAVEAAKDLMSSRLHS
ncbi:hypothetical protein BS78_04G131900 [Paspalum vaginatum]|nr:hypothetical protein BS78_04G131900 [Paspalum vaginatum]